MLVNALLLLWMGSRTISVGDALIDPSRVVPYEAKWRNLSVAKGEETETGVITERIERVELEGRPALRQVQVVEGAGEAGTSSTTMYFDPETLAVLRQESTSPGGQVVRTDYDWSTHQSTTRVDDGEASPPTAVECGFVAARPGLVMAALPLAEGFSARIPFGLTGQRWWATARVVGSTRFDPGDGVSREAWIVETDWEQVLDPNVVYGGDFDAAHGGGTWLFFKEPPRGAYALARIDYQMPGPDIVIEMRDGLGEGR